MKITNNENGSGNINFSLSVTVAFLVLMLGFASTGYGDIILGNWESADSNDGWLAFYDTGGGVNLVNDIIFSPDCPNGVTLGHGSLSIIPDANVGYYCLRWEGTPLTFTKGTFIKFDLTMPSADWPSGQWTKVGAKLAINSDGPSGWKEYGPDATSDTNLYSVIDRDTGLPTSFDWQSDWNPGVDGNKTYTYNVSSYDATGATWMNINITVQGSNGTGHFYFDNIRLVTPDVIVNKCTVTAGKTQYMDDNDYSDMTDTFTASGTISNLPSDLSTINHVDVNIISADGSSIFSRTIPVNPTTDVKRGKYTHSYKIPKGNPTQGAITSMTIDSNKKTFAVTVKNADLTGLTCPLELIFNMDGNDLQGYADETIVNGPKKLIPTRLMRTYQDTLVVNKAKATHNSRKGFSDTLSVTGDIAVIDTDVNLCNYDVNFVWGNQLFNVAPGKFKASKTGHLYKCIKDVNDANGAPGVVTAQVDIDKATFTLSVSKANGINATSNPILFGISFADFNEAVDVNRVTGRSWSY